jgi:hypothetical protein
VEVASIDGIVAVRDSKNLGGPTHGFAQSDWRTFSDDVKDGTFDL